MKKLFIILSLGLLLVGCGNTDDKTPDAETTASITDNANEVVASLGTNGNWITAITSDVNVTDTLTVEGTFYDKGDSANAVYRKLALHTQDSSFNIIDNFTLTVPTLVVNSENFTVFYGTIKGNIEVNAEGFTLVGTTVEGNITFKSAALRDAANLDKDGIGTIITGDITVSE